MKKLNKKQFKLFENSIKDNLKDAWRFARNKNPQNPVMDVNNPYYCEAYGMLRALAMLNYGELGAINVEGSLNHWFRELENEVEMIELGNKDQ